MLSYLDNKPSLHLPEPILYFQHYFENKCLSDMMRCEREEKSSPKGSFKPRLIALKRLRHALCQMRHQSC